MKTDRALRLDANELEQFGRTPRTRERTCAGIDPEIGSGGDIEFGPGVAVAHHLRQREDIIERQELVRILEVHHSNPASIGAASHFAVRYPLVAPYATGLTAVRRPILAGAENLHEPDFAVIGRNSIVMQSPCSLSPPVVRLSRLPATIRLR